MALPAPFRSLPGASPGSQEGRKTVLAGARHDTLDDLHRAFREGADAQAFQSLLCPDRQVSSLLKQPPKLRQWSEAHSSIRVQGGSQPGDRMSDSVSRYRAVTARFSRVDLAKLAPFEGHRLLLIRLHTPLPANAPEGPNEVRSLRCRERRRHEILRTMRTAAAARLCVVRQE